MPADVKREAAHLAERVPHAGERLGVLLGEELRAEVAAVLLVREHAEHEHRPAAPRPPPSRAGTR